MQVLRRSRANLPRIFLFILSLSALSGALPKSVTAQVSGTQPATYITKIGSVEVQFPIRLMPGAINQSRGADLDAMADLSDLFGKIDTIMREFALQSVAGASNI
jgi:hypothetical protein